jgi:hypothetical protein
VNDAGDVIPFCAAFFALAATLAMVASLERILGRPIPQLRNSRPVSKNRLFWAVPILMVVVIAWLWPRVVTRIVCSHCFQPHLWQQTHGIAFGSMLLLGFSGAVGWIAYYLLLFGTLMARLISRQRAVPKQ